MSLLKQLFGRKVQTQHEEGKVGLTKKQKDERAALKAGTHEKTVDDFGNPYLAALPTKPKQYVCVHCGGEVMEIVGEQITPGELAPYKHKPGQQHNCPKAWGPLDHADVKEAA